MIDTDQGVASVLTGGALIAWFREYRKGRKDANNFALHFMQTQSERIDKLVEQVAKLEAENRVAADALVLARDEINRLSQDLFKANAELDNYRGMN